MARAAPLSTHRTYGARGLKGMLLYRIAFARRRHFAFQGGMRKVCSPGELWVRSSDVLKASGIGRGEKVTDLIPHSSSVSSAGRILPYARRGTPVVSPPYLYGSDHVSHKM